MDHAHIELRTYIIQTQREDLCSIMRLLNHAQAEHCNWPTYQHCQIPAHKAAVQQQGARPRAEKCQHSYTMANGIRYSCARMTGR